jgi:hypothetical protein
MLLFALFVILSVSHADEDDLKFLEQDVSINPYVSDESDQSHQSETESISPTTLSVSVTTLHVSQTPILRTQTYFTQTLTNPRSAIASVSPVPTASHAPDPTPIPPPSISPVSTARPLPTRTQIPKTYIANILVNTTLSGPVITESQDHDIVFYEYSLTPADFATFIFPETTDDSHFTVANLILITSIDEPIAIFHSLKRDVTDPNYTLSVTSQITVTTTTNWPESSWGVNHLILTLPGFNRPAPLDDAKRDLYVTSLTLNDPWTQSNSDFPVDTSRVPITFGSLAVMKNFFPVSADDEDPKAPEIEVTLNDLTEITIQNQVEVTVQDTEGSTTIPAAEVVIDTTHDFELNIAAPIANKPSPPPVVVNLNGGEHQVVRINNPSENTGAKITLALTGGAATVQLPGPGIAVPVGIAAPIKPANNEATRLIIQETGAGDTIQFLQPASVTGHELQVQVPEQVTTVSFPNFVLDEPNAQFGITTKGDTSTFVRVKVNYGIVEKDSTPTKASKIEFLPDGNLSIGVLSTIELDQDTILGDEFVLRIDFIKGYHLADPIVTFTQQPSVFGAVKLVFNEDGTVTDYGMEVPSKLPTQVVIAGLNKEVAEKFAASIPPAGYEFRVSQNGNNFEVLAVAASIGNVPTEEPLFQTGAIVGIVFAVLILVAVVVGLVFMYLKKSKNMDNSDTDSTSSSNLSDAYGSEDAI